MTNPARTLPDGWIWRWLVGPIVYLGVIAVALVVVFDDTWPEALFMAAFLAAFCLIVTTVVTRRAGDR
jgi:ABC-type enterochelin transport system permease subunit